MQIDGFDWDSGNWPKCREHGLSKEAIEWALQGSITVFDDPFEGNEKRSRAIGKDQDDRPIFIVFCIRHLNGQTLMRPISARYMHKREIEHYER